MGFIDLEGREWALREAIIRVMMESYPNNLEDRQIANLLHIHPSFVHKELMKLEKEKMVRVFGNGFCLRRNYFVGMEAGKIMVKANEAVYEDQHFKIKVSKLKCLFIDGHSSSYLSGPI